MKKIVIASILLIVVLGLGILEINYTNFVYKDLLSKATQQNTIIDQINVGIQDNDKKTVKTDQTVSLANNILQQWQDNKQWMMSFTHHHIVLELDKSILRLHTLTHIDNFVDCKVECEIVINLLTELLSYNKVYYQNIL
jgi:hypothetical protein